MTGNILKNVLGVALCGYGHMVCEFLHKIIEMFIFAIPQIFFCYMYDKYCFQILAPN